MSTDRWFVSRESARLAAAGALGVVCALALGRFGHSGLAAPNLSSRAVQDWVDTTPPDVVVMTVIRLVATALAWYLAAISGVAFVCHRRRRPDLARRLCPRLLTRIVVGTTLTGLAGGLASHLAITGRETVRPVASTASPTVQPHAVDAPQPTPIDPPVMVWIGPVEHPQPPTPDNSAALLVLAPDPSNEATSSGQSTEDLWIIEAGDHLWAVAAETLTDRLPAAATESRIATYWHAVIELNRDVLLDPDNPDLVVPGQQILLPPIDR